MNSFVTLFITATFVLFAFVTAVRYSATSDEKWHPIVRFEDKIVEFEGANGEKIQPGAPVLYKGILLSATDNEIIIDVAYHVPAGSLAPYSLSIYPSQAGFQGQLIPLKEGSHKARVAIVFSPPSFMMARTKTDHFNVFISEHYGNKSAKIYRRKILIDRIWRRSKGLVGPYINNSHFGVIGGQTAPVK